VLATTGVLLCIVALWKRPRAVTVVIKIPSLSEPADWPNSVTLFGSSLNAAMFCCIHLSAAI